MRHYRVESLASRGVEHVVYVDPGDQKVESIADVNRLVESVANEFSRRYGVEIEDIEFRDNEDIGSRYILYRYRLYHRGGYIGCRVVTFLNRVHLILLTVGRGVL